MLKSRPASNAYSEIITITKLVLRYFVQWTVLALHKKKKTRGFSTRQDELPDRRPDASIWTSRWTSEQLAAHAS